MPTEATSPTPAVPPSTTPTQDPGAQTPEVQAAGVPDPAQAKPEPPKPKEPRDSTRFAALAKKEKALVQRQQELKARADALAKQQEAIKQYEAARQGARTNPLAALEALGLTYQELTDFVLADQKPTPDMAVKQVRDELEQLKADREAEKQRLVEEEKARLKKQEQDTLAAFYQELDAFVRSNADSYELINLHEAHELVHQVIEGHYQETKQILSNKEAADLVESYLEEQVQKSLTTKKLKAKAQPQPQEAVKPAQPPASKPTTTIHNQMARPSGVQGAHDREKERIRRAIAVIPD